MFKITVEIDMFDPVEKKMVKKQYKAEIDRSAEEKAIVEVQEDYVAEFGTDPEEIRIVQVEEI